MHSVMSVDEARHGTVSCHDGVLVDNLASIDLNGHMITDIVTAHSGEKSLFPFLDYN